MNRMDKLDFLFQGRRAFEIKLTLAKALVIHDAVSYVCVSVSAIEFIAIDLLGGARHSKIFAIVPS